MIKKVIALSFMVVMLFLSKSFGISSDIRKQIKKRNWNGIDVVWLEDDRFPTFDLIFYFADGSLSDSRYEKGATSAMFGLLGSGTNRYSAKEISDNLEFFGATRSSQVVHEYSTYYVSGLVKDIVPVVKKVCHLFHDANFPRREVRKEKKRAINGLNNMVSNPGGLINRAFREISMRNTPFDYPSGGKLRDIKRLNSRKLRKKLSYFNTKVSKKIYVTGPKDVLRIERIIKEECRWHGSKDQINRSVRYSSVPKFKKPKIYLVTVPKSIQAQIRIGRFLSKPEVSNMDLMTLASSFLGGGFTSKLMQEIRVKKGLTYSIGAVATRQKDYGRTTLYTFTKNESLEKMLTELKNILSDISKYPDGLERSRSYLIGSYPFLFETNFAFLNQLLYFDHINKSYDDFFNFQKNIKSLSKEEVFSAIADLFLWDNQFIVVLGKKSLLKQLKEFGDVKVVNYKKFL